MNLFIKYKHLDKSLNACPWKPKLVNGVIVAIIDNNSNNINESKLIKHYSFSGSKIINPHLFKSFLNNEEPKQHPDFDHIQMDKDLDSSATTQQTTLYSGITWNPGEYKSKIIHLPAYTSTSILSDVARKFSENNNHVLDIDTNGFKHTNISSESLHSSNYGQNNEYEHVLPRNTTLMLHGEPRHIKDHDSGVVYTHWPVKIVAQSNLRHEETRTNPETVASNKEATEEENERGIENTKTEDTLIKYGTQKNLNQKSIDFLAQHPSDKVKMSVVSNHSVNPVHLLNMLKSGISDHRLETAINKSNIPVSDEIARKMLDMNMIPTSGISDDVFNTHKHKLNNTFYRESTLTDKQINEGDKYSISNNKNLTSRQMLLHLKNNSGNFLTDTHIFKLLMGKTQPTIEENKKMNVNIPIQHIIDSKVSENKFDSLKKMCKPNIVIDDNTPLSSIGQAMSNLSSSYLNKLIFHTNSQHENSMFGGNPKQISAGHILLYSHNDLTPHTLAEIGKNRTILPINSENGVTNSLPLLIMSHKNMTKDASQKIIDSNKNNPHMNQMLNTHDKLRK